MAEAAQIGSMGPDSASAADPKRKRLEALRIQLANERSTFMSTWREIGDNISPQRQRYFTSETNKGTRRNQNIIDSTATTSARVLSAGIMGGLTSPARDWFKLAAQNPAFVVTSAVKEWLDEVNRIMRLIFNASNLYQCLPNIYNDCGVFGTAAMMAEEDLDNVIRFYTFPIGSYMIACDHKLNVCVFFREFRMTVRQLVMKFQRDPKDWSNFSAHVKSCWDQNRRDTWVDVYHVIHPNTEYDKSKSAAKYKKFCSDYFEKGTYGSASGEAMPNASTPDSNVFLRESGYDIFPVMVPRWQVAGEDVYGTNCPGMMAVGDVKALQVGWKRLLQAAEKVVNPPMKAPETFKSMVASILPGGMSWTQEGPNSGKYEPVFQIDPRFAEMFKLQEFFQKQIKKVFFEDLFMMISEDARTQPPTAEEIIEKRAEKMNILGPTVEQFYQDLLHPLIEITFEFGNRQGAFPPPPPEFAGQPLKLECISIMAQAQKILGVANKERFIGFVIREASETQDPSVMDIINKDEMNREYADALGIEEKNLNDPDKIAAMRQQRQQAAAQQQAAEQANQASQAAKNLSQADMKGDSALTRLMGSKEPALSPQV